MLRPLQLGIAGGLIWGISLFVCTILGIYTGYSEPFLKILESIYIGFDMTWPGAFLGAAYGFADGFIGLYLLAWINNKL